MEMYIYGAGSAGAEVLELLKLYYPAQSKSLCGFMDQNKKMPVHGIPIVPIENVNTNARIVIAIRSRDIAIEVQEELQRRGFSDVWWYSKRWKRYGVDFCREMCMSCKGWKAPFLPQAEMHIMDACNLNCRGCAHFSPIFHNGMPDYASRISDVRKFSQKFGHIFRFVLLGGEPFLNKEIGRYAEEIRKILPSSLIEIVTNGILIPGISAETLEAISANDICVSISEYEPTHGMIHEITRRLEDFRILYEVRSYESKQKFNIPLSLVKDSKYEKLCISNGCITIWNGKMARCPTLMYIDRFNQQFGQQLPNDGVMSLDEDIAGEELICKFKERVPLCDHCVRNEISWDVCSRPIRQEDFAVED